VNVLGCDVEKCSGVILVNLGTPEAPTTYAVRQFLKEFLSDQRVVEIPRVLWFPILFGVILPFRAPKVAKLYQQIWQDEGSPLKVETEKQVRALQQRLIQCSDNKAPKVSYAMTYGPRSIAKEIAALEAAGIDKILILPMYPQYSATTTAPVYDQCAQLAQSQRDVSNLIVHKHYFDRPDYHRALAESIRHHRDQHGSSEKLLFSFHGIPQRCVDLGDPYYDHCLHTAEKVAALLDLNADQWQMSFQSRLGKAQWLMPYTDKTLIEWAQSGIESVDVVCPAFAVDCLETIEEIDCENRELFMNNGGRHYEFIPCLNSQPLHIEMLANIVNEYFD